MEKNWKELWLKNYRGEGDTAELIDFLKKLNYGNRNNISYLPWATVERIFKLQDGQIETVPSKVVEDQNRTTIVEADRVLVREEFDEHGVVSRTYANSYFVNIRATWQGQTHVERYPLQDSSGRPLSTWTQNEINKAIQRGKVKAIAIVSGIGFKLFEDGDLQFEEENGPSPLFEKEKVVPQPTPKVKATPNSILTNTEPVPPVKENPVATKEIVKEPKSNIDREHLENEIKRIFLSGGDNKTAVIRAFIKEHGNNKVSDLTDEQLTRLYSLVA